MEKKTPEPSVHECHGSFNLPAYLWLETVLDAFPYSISLNSVFILNLLVLVPTASPKDTQADIRCQPD